MLCLMVKTLSSLLDWERGKDAHFPCFVLWVLHIATEQEELKRYMDQKGRYHNSPQHRRRQRLSQ